MMPVRFFSFAFDLKKKKIKTGIILDWNEV